VINPSYNTVEEEEEEEEEKTYDDLIIRCKAQMGNTFRIKREKI
jgi:hypothetical protein